MFFAIDSIVISINYWKIRLRLSELHIVKLIDNFIHVSVINEKYCMKPKNKIIYFKKPVIFKTVYKDCGIQLYCLWYHVAWSSIEVSGFGSLVFACRTNWLKNRKGPCFYNYAVFFAINSPVISKNVLKLIGNFIHLSFIYEKYYSLKINNQF